LACHCLGIDSLSPSFYSPIYGWDLVGGELVSKNELISEAFSCLNDFKRHRALAKTADIKGQKDSTNYHTLKCYELFDALELALRAIQKADREAQNK
jgi:hypothetical protein